MGLDQPSASSPSRAMCTSYPCAAAGTPAPRRYSARRRQSEFSCSRCGSAAGGSGVNGRTRAPPPRLALHPHSAAEMLDDLAADVQPQPAAVRLVGERVADLMEFVEDHVSGLRGLMPRPLSRTSTRRQPSRSASAISTRPFAVVAEFDGVRQQIEHDLDHAVEVGRHRRDLVGQAAPRPAMFFSLNSCPSRRACPR